MKLKSKQKTVLRKGHMKTRKSSIIKQKYSKPFQKKERIKPIVRNKTILTLQKVARRIPKQLKIKYQNKKKGKKFLSRKISKSK